MTHYHVGFNQPGYLPEADPATAATYHEAADIASWDLHVAAEAAADDETAARFEAVATEVRYIVPSRTFDGWEYYGPDGYVYWIAPCDDACDEA